MPDKALPVQPVEIKNADPVVVTVVDAAGAPVADSTLAAPAPASPGTKTTTTTTSTNAAASATVVKGEGHTLAPTTTEADDLVTEGQRRVNILWEHTQSYISMGVTFSTIAIIGTTVLIAGITGREITQAMATQINYLVVMTTLILSFYFSRTNHQATGGVGPKPDPSVQSR